MKKINIFAGIGIGIIIIAIGGWMVYSSERGQSISQKSSENLHEDVAKEVVLVIDEGEGLAKTFGAKFKEGMTAFNLLEIKTEESGLTLKTKTFDIGVMVEIIGNKENGQDGKYWLYYVNGEMPLVAADKKEIKPGDKVEFKFQKSPF